MKLRAPALDRPFDVVLVEPEIPPNTGNIARLCAATTSDLHLVGRLGFRIDQKSIRRAGLDYWHLVKVARHDDLASFFDALVFGRESVGLPQEVLEKYADSVAAIPTLGAVRSLNISNAVSIVLYEALRRTGSLATD